LTYFPEHFLTELVIFNSFLVIFSSDIKSDPSTVYEQNLCSFNKLKDISELFNSDCTVVRRKPWTTSWCPQWRPHLVTKQRPIVAQAQYRQTI